jgi:hypothetical protein
VTVFTRFDVDLKDCLTPRVRRRGLLERASGGDRYLDEMNVVRGVVDR